MEYIKVQDTKKIYLTPTFRMQMKKVTSFPCTIVEAPMGYGKTTSVREYLKGMEIRVLWQKIHDNSLSAFWKNFCSLFHEIDGECYESLLQIGFPTNSSTREKVLACIQNALSCEATVIVIDDYHLAESPEIDDFIEYLLWNEISELHIILTARYTQLPNMDELILKGYLQHIGKEELEFNTEEIKAYYKLCGVPLKDGEIKNLYAYTEGWISALYLMMLNYKDEGIITSCPIISRLIEKTIYLSFSQEIRDFFVHISFFDTFTLEQAAHMWQRENTAELLEEIIRKNAFVNYDEKNGIYQVHKIFSEFLQEILKQMKLVEKNKLYCLAAKWYSETGEYISALRYYYIVGAWDSLLGILEEDQGHSMINEYQGELISYYEECPASIKEKHPVALLVIAICLFSYNEVQRFGKVCEEIGCILQRNLSIENHAMHEIAGELELLLSFTKYNDLEEMGKHIKAATNLMKQPARFMDTRSGWTFGAPSVLYMFHREIGQLDRELELMKEMLPYYEKIAKGHGMGADHLMEAEICYMRGEFDNAEILTYKAIYIANTCIQQDIVICAVFLQLKIALCRGDYVFIVNNLEEIRKQTENEKQYHLLDTLELCHTFIKTLLGKKQDIPEWILNGNYASSKLYFPAVAFFNMVYGQVLLVKEEYHKLLGNKDYFIEIASVFPNLLAQIYNQIYLAAAYEKIHRREFAQTELEKALEMAFPDQILMPFVENCNVIEPLLMELHLCGIHKEFISEILKLYKPYKGALYGILKENSTKEKPVLAEREAEVAKLVAQGLSNREIGLQLYISTNTVKTILKRIFDKLGINSRNMLKQYIEA